MNDILVSMRSGLIGRVRRLILNPWFLSVAIALAAILLLVNSLGNNPAGLSPQEASARESAASISQILHNPVNAPHKLLAYGLHTAGLNWKPALRASSAFYSLLFISCLYILLRGWFGKSIGLLGTLFFAATPIFLVLARQGTAAVLLFAPIVLIAIYMRLPKIEKVSFGFAALAVTGALCLYVPGMIWWIITGLILGRKKISALSEGLAPSVITAAVLFCLLLIVPLGLALVNDWTIIKQLALVPDQFAKPLTELKDVAWMAGAIFVKAPYHSDYILGRLPLINIIQIALLVFGGYALWSASRKKLFILTANILFAILAAGINNRLVLLALGLPAISVIVGAGLRYLYIEWRGVFPRNPAARGVALSLMAAVVVVHLLFGLRYALVAWPNSAPTKSTYVLK